MKKKILLPICLVSLSLSACTGGSKSLFGEANIALDSNQISQVLLGYLESREHVSSAEINIELNDNVISDSALLFSDYVSSSSTIKYNRYSNTAIGFTLNEASETTSSSTGFSYNSEVSVEGYSWLALNEEDESGEEFNHYSYTQTSYNNGYKSISSSTIGSTASDKRQSYWKAYVVDSFFNNLISTYMDYSYLSSNGRNNSLYTDFASHYDLFDNYTSLTFISSDDNIIAYATESEISELTNPLYVNDSEKNIAVMSIKTISYELENDPNYGFILSKVNVSYTYELLESLDNVYLSNPWVVETYDFTLSYSYSDGLSSTSLPLIESSEASFYPILSTYQEVYSDGDTSEGVGEESGSTEYEDDLDIDLEDSEVPLAQYERINGTRYTDIVNMTSYYQNEDSSFTGSAYELEIEVSDVTNAYSFSTSQSFDDEGERVFNLWGYNDIVASSFSSSLLEEVTSTDTENLFSITRRGTYSFVLLFDENHSLVSISMYVLNMD